MKTATIEINKADFDSIRRYLTARRRGVAFNADDDANMQVILRRVGFAASEAVFPESNRTSGICVVCGCTERDACTEPVGICTWEPGYNNTICTNCSEA